MFWEKSQKSWVKDIQSQSEFESYTSKSWSRIETLVFCTKQIKLMLIGSVIYSEVYSMLEKA
jgi:hypothetical protein